MSVQPSSSVYTDLKGLDQLKHSIKGDSVEDLRVAARQFEAIFVQQMLKTMREASLSEGLFDSNEGDFYIELLDKQLALNMSEGRGLGLADILVEQLSRTLKLKQDTTEDTGITATTPIQRTAPGPVLPVSPSSKDVPTLSVESVGQDNVESAESLKSVVTVEENTEESAESSNRVESVLVPADVVGQGDVTAAGERQEIIDPQTFIETLWPLAGKAAEQLGVKPHVLIAQAALETGWGQYIGRDKNGKSSHNLFNIKAGGGWQGETITVMTTEFKNGEAVKEYAAFRAYDSYKDSFADYVSLIKNSPRYKRALNSTDSKSYIRALQQAGFATDPKYSGKILDIANGRTMTQATQVINTAKAIKALKI